MEPEFPLRVKRWSAYCVVEKLGTFVRVKELLVFDQVAGHGSVPILPPKCSTGRAKPVKLATAAALELELLELELELLELELELLLDEEPIGQHIAKASTYHSPPFSPPYGAVKKQPLVSQPSGQKN
jgi:hypothetical protein